MFIKSITLLALLATAAQPGFISIGWAQSSPMTAGQPGTPQTGHVQITDAWSRATPGADTPGVVYLTITSPTADRLTAVSSPAAGKAELHTMTMEGTVMRMRPVDGLDIPAGQPVALKPGGLHIMLVGLARPLREGQSFPLTLSFEKAGPQQVTVTVEKLGAMGPLKAPPNGASGAMPMAH